MSRTHDIRMTLERRKGERNKLLQLQSGLGLKLKETGRDLRRHEQAREVIREVGLKTQQQLQYHISDITTMALDAVFPDPYEMVVEFVQRRNKTECDLYFERDGMRADPLTAAGGGAVDVAAFALRIASWSMRRPRSRATIILDEPLKYVSANLQEQASAMLKEVSKRLDIQFIIVTHEPVLTSYADRVFEVEMKRGKSKIVQK